MNTDDIKKFFLSLVLYKEEFYKYTLENNKIYKININKKYIKIKNIYNEILKDKVFNETFDEFIDKLEDFIILNDFYKFYLIDYDIIFLLDDFVDHNIIIFAEEQKNKFNKKPKYKIGFINLF